MVQRNSEIKATEKLIEENKIALKESAVNLQKMKDLMAHIEKSSAEAERKIRMLL